MLACIAIWVNHSNIGENVRVTALQGAEVLLAPHQTGGCDSPDPHTMGLVDKALWENRHGDPAAIEAELLDHVWSVGEFLFFRVPPWGQEGMAA
jgi:hypothetical protein